MTPDSNLIQQAQQGNTDAFEQLMRRYQEQIFRISRSIVKNSQDAEDIVQDTFLQAYLKLDQLRQPKGFFSWLQKIAVNLSKNHKSQAQDSICRIQISHIMAGAQMLLHHFYFSQKICLSALVVPKHGLYGTNIFNTD